MVLLLILLGVFIGSFLVLLVVHFVMHGAVLMIFPLVMLREWLVSVNLLFNLTNVSYSCTTVAFKFDGHTQYIDLFSVIVFNVIFILDIFIYLYCL